MFENIFYQNIIVSSLKKQIAEKSLPASLLFSGPAYSAKLSTSLELARALSCKNGQAAWNCSCHSCKLHRYLIHPDMLLLGPRYFMEEIQACADTLQRIDNPATRFLFLRSLQKLLLRFNPVLWEGSESKVNKFSSQVQEIEELLDQVKPEGKTLEEKKKTKTIEKIIKNASVLNEFLPDASIPVHQIRNLIYWSHLSSTGHKTIIIENAESLQDSSRNALLKLLEEPPKSLSLILLCKRRNILIPTLLSRLRHYEFKKRSGKEEREVLKEIFREEEKSYHNLDDFFKIWQSEKPGQMTVMVHHFVRDILEKKAMPSQEYQIACKKEHLASFLEELCIFLDDLLYQPVKYPEFEKLDDFILLGKWSEIIKKTEIDFKTFNLNPELLFQSLFFKLEHCL